MPKARATKAERQLDALAADLERAHEDPLRVDLVRCAQRFKRSWVELAEALARARDTAAYERWGYPNLHSYCNHELQIKPATVDKLLLSFTTLERHAPQMLRADAAEDVPSYQALHYYARNVEDEGRDDGARRFVHLDENQREEALDALHRAVFEESQPVAELRRRFDPVLRPKPPEAVAQEAIHKLKLATTKVLECLVQVEGLPQERIEAVESALEALRQDLDSLSEADRPSTQGSAAVVSISRPRRSRATT